MKSNPRSESVQSKRSGITLLEVIFALVIFLGSFVALNQLVSVATNNAYYVQQQGQAMLLCQSKLAEINAGIIALPGQGEYAPITSDGAWANTIDENWQWKMTANPDYDGITNCYSVQVWVKREVDGKKVEVSLSQILFDPTKRGSTADVPSTNTDPNNSGGAAAKGGS